MERHSLSEAHPHPWLYQLGIAQEAIAGVDKFVRDNLNVEFGFPHKSSSLELYKEFLAPIDLEAFFERLQKAVGKLLGTPNYSEVPIDKSRKYLKEGQFRQWKIKDGSQYKMNGSRLLAYIKGDYVRLEIKCNLGQISQEHIPVVGTFEILKRAAQNMANLLDDIEREMEYSPPKINVEKLRRSICKRIHIKPNNRALDMLLKQIESYSCYCCADIKDENLQMSDHHIRLLSSGPNRIFIPSYEQKICLKTGTKAPGRRKVLRLIDGWETRTHKKIPTAKKKDLLDRLELLEGVSGYIIDKKVVLFPTRRPTIVS